MKNVIAIRQNRERANPDYVPEKEAYSLHGCPFAVQVWALEIFSEVCETFSSKCKHVKYPRILNWTITKHVSSNSLDYSIFDKKKVLEKLDVADEIEASQPNLQWFWQTNWLQQLENDLRYLDTLARGEDIQTNCTHAHVSSYRKQLAERLFYDQSLLSKSN
ncbi:hypothetical protein WN944_026903 [Citrus x changshan-huyou]|uniref:Uncharacterized protein n=1 Tax=Citrus x changshan-huyou TaxID=2935761 RepID=A0AAP0LMP2_9ROSI